METMAKDNERLGDKSCYWKTCAKSKSKQQQDIDIKLEMMAKENEGLRDKSHWLKIQLQRAIDVMKVLRARLKLSNNTANHLMRFAKEYSILTQELLPISAFQLLDVIQRHCNRG